MRMFLFHCCVLLDFGSLIFICDHCSINMTSLTPGYKMWSASDLYNSNILTFLYGFLDWILWTLWSDFIFHRHFAKLVSRWEGGSFIASKTQIQRWQVEDPHKWHYCTDCTYFSDFTYQKDVFHDSPRQQKWQASLASWYRAATAVMTFLFAAMLFSTPRLDIFFIIVNTMYRLHFHLADPVYPVFLILSILIWGVKGCKAAIDLDIYASLSSSFS